MREELKDNRNMRIGYIDKQLNGQITIFDKNGARIGEIRPSGHRLEAMDRTGRKFAYWDETNDTTFEWNGRRIDKGNLLIPMYFQN